MNDVEIALVVEVGETEAAQSDRHYRRTGRGREWRPSRASRPPGLLIAAHPAAKDYRRSSRLPT